MIDVEGRLETGGLFAFGGVRGAGGLVGIVVVPRPPTQHPRAAIFRRRQIACLVRRVRPAFIPVLAMAGLRGGRMETV